MENGVFHIHQHKVLCIFLIGHTDQVIQPSAIEEYIIIHLGVCAMIQLDNHILSDIIVLEPYRHLSILRIFMMLVDKRIELLFQSLGVQGLNGLSQNFLLIPRHETVDIHVTSALRTCNKHVLAVIHVYRMMHVFDLDFLAVLHSDGLVNHPRLFYLQHVSILRKQLGEDLLQGNSLLNLIR